MELTLKRQHYTTTTTLGTLEVDGKFFSFVLEDVVRDSDESKIWGKTAIPSGKYHLIITMSPKFKRMMPLLVDVPGFSGVRIHGGNTHEHTHGCPLIAKNIVSEERIQGSMEHELTALLIASKEDHHITIQDLEHDVDFVKKYKK